MAMIWYGSSVTDKYCPRSYGSSDFWFVFDIWLFVLFYILYMASHCYSPFSIWIRHTTSYYYYTLPVGAHHCPLVTIHRCRFKPDTPVNGSYGYLALVQLWVTNSFFITYFLCVPLAYGGTVWLIVSFSLPSGLMVD